MREEDIELPPHYIFLGLIKLSGIGFQTLYNFFHNGKRLSDLMMTQSYDEFKTLLGRSIDIDKQSVSDWSGFLNEVVKNGQNSFYELKKRNIRFLLHTDYQFPTFPVDMKLPIYWLFVEGKLENLYVNKSLTLIGSRDSSAIGYFLAQTLLFGVSGVKEPLVTISGLAAGIDQMVHELSLFLDIPTIAVLGNGLNEDYPANSKRLRKEILDSGGTLVTEYFPDMKPSKESFVSRNRIQSALASTVIPLEWKEKSGTAHTIRFAHEMKKQICFVETALCRKAFSEHALANSSAQRKYGGDIFVLPNAITNLIETLGLTSDQKIQFVSNDNAISNEKKGFTQPVQIGLDF
ncbi:DNA-processing protein DprA [uncultured Acinetobacter sp.]|uniref:DNA-processing protein DprA n=1 Tax=uncultured Acinetobacter sp. TaxID=165433 RepID=UPI0025872A26|nr:DNA-processing protein DprA [uncultured Acinetobacter sp.]